MSIAISTRAKDVHTWCVTYHDGTQVPEFDQERLDGRGFGEIDTSQVRTIELLGKHRVDVPKGALPVFFRRRRTVINPNNGRQTGLDAVHCIGWKKDEQAVYLFVFEDGSTLLSSDLQAV